MSNSEKIKMKKQIEKKYNVKLQDFTPFAGSFIYQSRNWKEAKKNGRLFPEPNDKYMTTGLRLTVVDMITGFASGYAIFRGLETLIK